VSNNPFDDEGAGFFALLNGEEQHSPWPAFAAIPDGWQTVHGEDGRAACLNYVEANWTDIRPRSMRKRLAEHGV
jgi:uncharacterized protein YbdZ (MbtH family)